MLHQASGEAGRLWGWGKWDGITHAYDFAVQGLHLLPPDFGLGHVTCLDQWCGIQCDLTEALTVHAQLNWASGSPAIHQRKNLPQVVAASSALVPGWETSGADMNSAFRRAVRAGCQTHKQGFGVSQWNFGRTSLAWQTNPLQPIQLTQEDTKIKSDL